MGTYIEADHKKQNKELCKGGRPITRHQIEKRSDQEYGDSFLRNHNQRIIGVNLRKSLTVLNKDFTLLKYRCRVYEIAL